MRKPTKAILKAVLHELVESDPEGVADAWIAGKHKRREETDRNEMEKLLLRNK